MGLAGLGSSLWVCEGIFRSRHCGARERSSWRIFEAWVLFGFVSWVLVEKQGEER